MQAINVPSHHQGRGLARLLAEAALTYAIVNDYYMLLNCEYMQKFYLATKSPELEERVIGPKHILEAQQSDPLDSETVQELPEPEDFEVPFTK
ncbi:protein NATD1 isoform X2 [Venturia canescens]|nr:protein NATD1-like isoform X2 [Venturia canescens]